MIKGDDLISQHYPAIHAVGRASHRAPRLIHLEWGNADAPRVSLVGKGVCFDTGGLNIKASAGMRNMKTVSYTHLDVYKRQAYDPLLDHEALRREGLL